MEVIYSNKLEMDGRIQWLKWSRKKIRFFFKPKHILVTNLWKRKTIEGARDIADNQVFTFLFNTLLKTQGQTLRARKHLCEAQ